MMIIIILFHNDLLGYLLHSGLKISSTATVEGTVFQPSLFHIYRLQEEKERRESCCIVICWFRDHSKLRLQINGQKIMHPLGRTVSTLRV